MQNVILNKAVEFTLKFQTVAEKTAKNFRGLLFCRTLYWGAHKRFISTKCTA